MIFDHLLALHFLRWHPTDLKEFSKLVYQQLLGQKSGFPVGSLPTLEYMTKHDWLTGYASKEGLDRALKGLGGRVRFRNDLAGATVVFSDNFNFFNNSFERFFPDLQASSVTWLGKARNN